MAHLKFRNVNDSFRGLVKLFRDGGKSDDGQHIEISKTSSRNGPVLQILEPMVITFSHPTERVLFNQERDANCFFHLFESLYMLSGGNLIEPLAYYAPTMKNYSDDGVTQNGAYGYRWRHADVNYDRQQEIAGLFSKVEESGTRVFCETDQLKVIINHLKAKPDSRRAVLQMWNVEDDLLKMDTSKDICCNTQVMFSIRRTWCQSCKEWWLPGSIMNEVEGQVRSQLGLGNLLCEDCRGKTPVDYLDMTVINRSNDLVWGMLGANVVHFSFLQEYMAENLGVGVGVYNQMSNNLHIYTENNSGFKHEEWLNDNNLSYETDDSIKPFSLIQDPVVFERELPRFIESSIKHEFLCNYTEPFLQLVATPMLWSFELHKRRDYTSALNAIKECAADDWKITGRNWLLKRQANWEARKGEKNES